MTGTITYTVTTTAGSRKHVIDNDSENAAITDSIRDAFDGRRPGFTLLNPITLYALDNVISVSIEGGPPEAIQEVRRRLNFANNNGK